MAKYHYLTKYAGIYHYFENICECITLLEFEFVKLKFAV